MSGEARTGAEIIAVFSVVNACSYSGSQAQVVFVVATTHWNGTRSMLTLAKLSVCYLVVGITRELNKEPLMHYSSIYINILWSMLQQY